MVKDYRRPEEWQEAWCFVPEATEILGISASTLRRYCRLNGGFLKHVRDDRGRLVCLSRADVEAEAAYRAANGGLWMTLEVIA